MWPLKTEKRAAASYTDAVVAGLLASATGSQTAPVATLAAVEACAGLWGRSFASAAVTPSTAATAPLTPAILERIGRGLLLRGEAVFAIEVDRGELKLIEAASWNISGHDAWTYRIDVSTPSGSTARTLPADQVLHPRIGATPARPWQGSSPLPSATAKLAATLESKLTEEVGGPVGSLVPMPHAGDTLEKLNADIKGLRGQLVFVESTAGGGGDKASAPKADWVPQRVGAAVPSSLIELRRETSMGILAAAGVPTTLMSNVDGTAKREDYRRFLHATIAPVSLVVAAELAVKLDEPELAFDLSSLFASDLSGRARAFGSLVKGGMSASDAAALAGLLVADE